MTYKKLIKTETFKQLIMLVRKVDTFSHYCRHAEATPGICSVIRGIDEKISLLIICLKECAGIELEVKFDRDGFGIVTKDGEWLWRFTR